ncbi:GH1 family beta-glucosidase [Consotaella salsifontis]|uniref:Beta-glucosidase n=1 Tax=Consotaella salsifontis TaxID=1365950 RepID=A0A1T4PP07_9HYPH|nr:GH1 family beta-glucosidase [Consotaella salsifontis]SJZ93345.1 beta-glucosidase [Consotaella salsifontis]
MTRQFPAGFLWGAAASAFQTEGAAAIDGRGPTVWDDFTRAPGKIRNGDTADVACDFYHRYPEDIALMKGLGLGAFRLSTAWSRILPSGRGTVNPLGLDFYDRVIDLMLHEGIEPWICLHHWDMPSPIEADGGWRNRDCARWFADYAAIVGRHFGDRVKRFVPINEPNVIPWVAYNVGRHAPGRQSREDTVKAIHHINLAHGLTIQAVRAEAPGAEAGNIVSLGPVHPAVDDEAHRAVLPLAECIWRRVMVDPLWLGTYPEPLATEIEPHIAEGDMAVIRQPLDFFGLNHYNRVYVAPTDTTMWGLIERVPPPGYPLTDVNWRIDPSALVEQIEDVGSRYGHPPIYITEGGCAFPDALRPDRSVHDPDRIAYFADYFTALAGAIENGADVRGYFAWSLMDNFEWNSGFTKRFGLVYTDYPTLQRIPKSSYYWMRGVIAKNAVIPPEGRP